MNNVKESEGIEERSRKKTGKKTCLPAVARHGQHTTSHSSFLDRQETLHYVGTQGQADDECQASGQNISGFLAD